MKHKDWQDAISILQTAQFQILDETYKNKALALNRGYAILSAASLHIDIEFLTECRQKTAGKYVDVLFNRADNL